ncbi:MAG: hypothetical protein A3E00_18070 [Curvibacter sp. RIFCSPHIGHO2_12_FULL_63_18]|uniref:hypothetical protein n=1 Tax=Rhodoferax sp. TaxID=50421 RepID=UPI0008CDA706|nr:hypothetical protein [Rhodoferax sp.]OGO95767.1 MAG: hypothetical protein A2037_00025 [Curvibacter sp. GWA2_63_95]OGP05754.1 MAG: hypothetical protein A3E00_18070 [Curvibacter sp. RIFCSPHIGHO2_12_FULL_63_18]HCX81547.1 hypothetical protein [Rhodoferax sp.]
MKIHTVLAGLVLVASGAAFAQTTTLAPKDPLATPKIDQRDANQDKRVAQGVESGQLTRRETRRLNRGEVRIDKAEDHAAADGKVTGQERKRIAHMQRAESRDIAHQKHDRQVDLNHDGKRDGKNGKL